VIAAEATPPDDPGKRSLDHPSSGLGTKARWKELVPVHLFPLIDKQSPLGNSECLDGLDHPPQCSLGPQTEGTSIVTISPDQLETGKLFLQWRQQGSPTFLVRFLGSRHLDGQEMALRINECMAFPAPRFFFPYRSPSRDRELRSF
jgi:hypothetical protein